ncbi:hypothetical protein PENARI_c017G01199 [Penicillium arizonense]|uniref:Uncharacterized protein n=1 Tax=Penicillium arizonense TaxID=1835702 RepID=A0A1F5LB70_PENAI|nr:hypothetical protein PENARI_c017G01199 [Penicillium arizonense]OGE50435.1 hypothetical protein PENARI_c017G01199 [Penicillium arizonense]
MDTVAGTVPGWATPFRHMFVLSIAYSLRPLSRILSFPPSSSSFNALTLHDLATSLTSKSLADPTRSLRVDHNIGLLQLIVNLTNHPPLVGKSDTNPLLPLR